MCATKGRWNRIACRLLGSVAALFLCGWAGPLPARGESITTLQLDVNGITVQARDPAGQNVAFGAGPFTGSLAFGFGDGANLNSVMIDGANRPEYRATLAGVTGHLDFIDDAIAGGVLSLSVRNADASLDTYGLTFVPGSGSLLNATNALLLQTVGNQAKGDTAGGSFDKATFGQVDVSPWFDAGPSAGSFLAFKYNPNAQGFDGSVDLDLSVRAPAPPAPSAVPLPSSAWAGLALFGVLAARRSFGALRIFRAAGADRLR